MPRYRHALPQLADRLFVTDGGIETALIHHHGMVLPEFAAFVLLNRRDGLEALGHYYLRYAELAARHHTGLVLESPTWRASTDWGQRLGFSDRDLADINRRAIALIACFRARTDLRHLPVVLSGNLGPRGDGYVPAAQMTAAEAADYHAPQIATFATTNADLVSAFTLNYTEEAIGIVRAAKEAAMPVVISFTVETDGLLPTGESIGSAIERTDASTGGGPAYYMINCAHPSHFAGQLVRGGAWVSRIRGLRANASELSHAELNDAVTLDEGDPRALGSAYRRLVQTLPGLTVLGGCCGTDHRHVEAMAQAVLYPARAA